MESKSTNVNYMTDGTSGTPLFNKENTDDYYWHPSKGWVNKAKSKKTEELPQRGWIISGNGSIIHREDSNYGYGNVIVSNVLSGWNDNYVCKFSSKNWRKATKDEVKDMLLAEAKKRYVDNVVLNLYSSHNGVLDYNSSSLYSSGDFWIRIKSKDKNCKVFDNGKWADVEEKSADYITPWWDSFTWGNAIDKTKEEIEIPPLGFNEEGDMLAKSALETQIEGTHYKDYKIQPIEFIQANNLSFEVGNILKYIMRHQDKNGKKDLEKAKHYIDLMIEHHYKDVEAK